MTVNLAVNKMRRNKHRTRLGNSDMTRTISEIQNCTYHFSECVWRRTSEENVSTATHCSTPHHMSYHTVHTITAGQCNEQKSLPLH